VDTPFVSPVESDKGRPGAQSLATVASLTGFQYTPVEIAEISGLSRTSPTSGVLTTSQGCRDYPPS